MKKIIIIFIFGIIISILIYYLTCYKKTDIMVIGDSVSTGDSIYGNTGVNFNIYLKTYLKNKDIGNYDITYTKNNFTVKEFNYQFDENNEINDIHLQNRIARSEIIIIALGQDELINSSKINNLKNKERQLFYENYKIMLNNIRKVSKSEIIIVGYYSNQINNLDEIESNIINISKNYQSKYLKIRNIINQDDYFDNDAHLNYKGYKKIFELLKQQIRL